jgi:hypothetical protein
MKQEQLTNTIMKKLLFYLILLLLLPVAIYAQYSGGVGRGDFSLTLNGTFLSNYFQTAGNWSAAANWSEGVLPAPSGNAKVAAAAIVDGDYAYQALTIASIGSVTISPGKSLTISGAITNDAGTGGLVIQSNASLLNNATNVSGSVQRPIASNNQWHFLSCPMAQATMPEICDGNFAPLVTNFNASTGATYDFFFWQEPHAVGNLNWISLKKPDWSVNTLKFGNPPRFVTGKGYLVEYSSAFSGSSEKTFAGSLGAGSIDLPVTKTAGGNFYNLLGNPYPSYIDWKAPVGWTRGVIEDEGGGKNVWIWNGTTGNYGVYNSASSGDAGTNGVSRYIAPVQGFFVKAASNGNVTVADDVRCHSSQAWLKADENNLRLNVTSFLNGYSDEVLVEFGHAVNGGAEKWFSIYSEAPSLYMPVGENIFSLRFLGNVSENPALPLSFKAGVDGNYSITASGTESFTNVILQDLKTGTTQEMKTTPVYNFTSSITDEASRFMLRFSPVGIETQDAGNNGIFVYDNILNITNPGESVIAVYNIVGQKILERQTQSEGLVQIKLEIQTGYYIVKLTTGQKSFAKKIFVK